MTKHLGASPVATGLAGAERWRPVPGFEGRYEVSDKGRVRSLSFSPPRLKAAYPDKDGYPVIALWRRPLRRQMNLHRLVAEVFHADRRNALHSEVAHLDGDRANARADNLKWVSKVENHFHQRAHGTHQYRANHGAAKLTEAQVAAIARTPSGAPRAELAAKYGVCRDTISSIRSGRSWKSK